MGSIRIQSHGFRVLLGTLLFSLAALPWAAGSPGARVLVALVPSASLAAVLYATSASRWMLWAGALVFVPSLLGWWQHVLDLPASLGILGLFCGTVFLGSAAAMLWGPVFGSRRIGEDTLVGALCIYLLLCLAFANAHLLAWTVAPSSFSFATGEGGVVAFADFVYFSLVTLTTLGYGDVVPVGGAARSLVIVETVAGILYPSIAVARLVALHVTGGPSQPLVSASAREGRRSRNLLVLMTSLIVLRTALGRAPSAVLALSADSLLLVAVLYGLGGSPRVLRLALVPAAAALLAGWWSGGDRDGLAVTLGLALEVCFYAIGLASIGLRALRVRAVTREMLYGACCVYLLLGIAFENAFTLLERLTPGALALPGAQAASSELLYFSFMTLTTTGYGDITPLTPAGHLLAGFEATLGIFYPAILVARLVALYGSDEAPPAPYEEG